MTGEVHHVRAQAKFGIELPHCCLLWVNAFKSFGVVNVDIGHKAQELFEAPFLKQTQQFLRRQSETVKATQQNGDRQPVLASQNTTNGVNGAHECQKHLKGPVKALALIALCLLKPDPCSASSGSKLCEIS